jgi:hypothetical protein
MLKKFMVGALTTAIVAGGASMAVAGNGDDGDDDDGDVIRVTARFINEAEVDLPPSGFGAGDKFVITQDLYRDEEKVGHSGIECTFVRLEGEAAATAQCVASFVLPAGQITVQGLVTFTQDDEPFTVAVTGGTGRYRDADGELRVEPVSEEEERLTFRLD